jgi:hypothetical protein
MKTIILNSDRQKTYAENLIKESPADGSMTVIIKQTDMSSTARQRRLQWLWYTEVSQSGLGQDDTKEAVHVRAKMMFAHPILMRDDDVYPLLYSTFKKAVENSTVYSAYIKEFASQYISTERLTRKQRAEYLSEFQRYWINKGVELTDPATQGLDQYFGGNNGI